MPRGGARPGAGRPKGSGKPLPKAPKAVAIAANASNLTPLDYMLAIMRDDSQAPELRAKMAVAAAPYVHPKPGDVAKGKKEQAEDAAKTAGQGTEWGDDLAAPLN